MPYSWVIILNAVLLAVCLFGSLFVWQLAGYLFVN